MISSINMSGVATFTGQSSNISTLKKINYFFGGNGTGKTSIGRVIDNPDEVDRGRFYCQLSAKASPVNPNAG
jgi:replication-associated recombination protein RarA